MEKKKLPIWLIIISILLFLILTLFLIYIFVIEKFHINSFQDNLTIEYLSTYKDNSSICYGSSFRCKEIKPTITGEVNTSILGDYKLTFTYKYKKKTLTKEQNIKVVDTTKPNIEITDEEFTYCPNGTFKKFNATATDNYDQALEVKQTLKDGQILFSAKDSSGNETNIYKDAKMLDNEAPTITLKGSTSTYVALNSVYKDAGATATDNCDANLTSKITTSGTVDTTKNGEYTITYKVTDQSGNTKTATRKVFVYSKNDYSTPTGKSIYLTFDDGPGPYTSKLLDILKKYNVKATFFVTNQALTKNYDSVILRAYQEGHTIGLHTNTHNYNVYTSEDTYFNDLYAIQNKVKSITGYTSTIIRFPGGSSNTISKNYDGGQKIMSTLVKAVEAKGFRYWDWNVDSNDAGGASTSSKVASNIISSLGRGNTYVVLQHDIKGYSVNAVAEVIEYGLSHGYTFRPITMDTPTVHHRVNN